MSTEKVVLLYGISALACLAAIAYQSECDPWELAARDEAKFWMSSDKLMDSSVAPNMIATWFHWITNVREIDRLPLMKGKSYMGQYMIGPFGPYRILLRASEHSPGRSLTVAADSKLKPLLQIQVDKLGDGGSNLRVSMVFNRTSVLFQYTLGFAARQLTANWFRHSLFLLRMSARPEPGHHHQHPDDIHGLDDDLADLADMDGVEVSDEVKVDLSGRM